MLNLAEKRREREAARKACEKMKGKAAWTFDRIKEADEPAVIALWREVLPDTAPHNEPGQVIRQKRAFERDLLFVAGIVVGTVMGGYDGHRGWLYSVAVRPEHRRAGIGAALVHRLERALAERG
jgi:ribosomal protein S18 acetylase RimI-like enzyme